MNLTAITEFDEVIEKHFLDSLSLIKVYDLKKEVSVMDMGTRRISWDSFENRISKSEDDTC